MAILRKFRAIRPKPGLEAKIASYPYDVINSEEAREIANGNEYSFLHINKPEIDLPIGTYLYSEEVYLKARDNFQSFVKNGWFIQDEKEMLYVYRQTMDGREQYGIVGCCSADDFYNDIIKKHEHTRKAKEEDRIKHVDVTNINAGPIFLTYRSNNAINGIVDLVVRNIPIYDFVASDGIGHTVWIIEDDSLGTKLTEEFGRIRYLYIADGHHRAASGAMVARRRQAKNPNHTGNEEYNFFLSVLFPDNQLRIFDYNRVLKNLNGNSEEEMFNELDNTFIVEKIGENQYKPRAKGEIGMYYENSWYKLIIKPEQRIENDPVKSLDISVLQDKILEPFFGIEDPRTSDDIDFIGGIRGLNELEKLVDSVKFKVAFAMFPTSVRELMNIADAGKVMPPKSTWFEPKLRSGLLVHSLD
ncbi:MAG: DUF1015 family protein [Candidatus Delongbacteria bacterium]|nr:DUF1015 family protein [Candidatus Delongbacteria bacterium]MCG2760942.1 DUF1015 family protein [Candidatus Delongbacteria bacterium]